MPIDIQVPDDFFTNDEVEKLKELFNVEKDQDFRKALNGAALAGIEEYRDMFLGDGLPTRAEDIKQFRLFYLIKHYFENRIPNELEISIMFQIPESRSRNLIRYVLARFRHDLEQEILNTIHLIIKNIDPEKEKDPYKIYIAGDNIVDEINRIIALSGIKYKFLTKVQGESHLYRITIDSLEKVQEYLKKYMKV